jgi:diphosphomevalonate decarboxylase
MKKTVTARAPINIALIKYWGKADPQLVLPFNPSISLSLSVFETITTLKEHTDDNVIFTLNGKPDETMKQRLIPFLKQFNGGIEPRHLAIESINTGPTAAGLASSASAFAALAKAADAYYECFSTDAELAKRTRIGSGSAVRSLYGGCVKWKTDGFVERLEWPFKDTIMAILVLDATKKEVGSTDAMRRTVETAPNYSAWVKQSHQDAKAFEAALEARDFTAVGELAERNALALHAICEATIPPIRYLTERSKAIIANLQAARKAGTFEAYATMDAGPNIKLLLRETTRDHLSAWLKSHDYPTPIYSQIDLLGAVICDE